MKNMKTGITTILSFGVLGVALLTSGQAKATHGFASATGVPSGSGCGGSTGNPVYPAGEWYAYSNDHTTVAAGGSCTSGSYFALAEYELLLNGTARTEYLNNDYITSGGPSGGYGYGYGASMYCNNVYQSTVVEAPGFATGDSVSFGCTGTMGYAYAFEYVYN